MTPPSPDPSKESAIDRRGFFRHFLIKGVDRVEKTVRSASQRLNLAMAQAGSAPPAPVAGPGDTLTYLRPPGALPEAQFLTACTRCDKCVQACPARCIRMDETTAGARPYIIARAAACVVCDDLTCMKVCTTGALKLVPSVNEIHMGVAVVDQARCLRGPAGQHEDCRTCLTACPLGEKAIGLDPAGAVEVRAGCIGCGLCERACPTEPASIWVKPERDL